MTRKTNPTRDQRDDRDRGDDRHDRNEKPQEPRDEQKPGDDQKPDDDQDKPSRMGEREKEQYDHQQVLERTAPGGQIVYRAILFEAFEELDRPTVALFWSGLAAGLSMGFSLVAQGLLRHHLPHDAAWAPLVIRFGYSIGFLIVILGRQQLFTENTLTPMLPLLQNRDWPTFRNVMRLWSVVLVSNLLGALIVALALTHTSAFTPDIREQFVAIGKEALDPAPGSIFIKAIFAGWLIAMMVWMLPFAESAHVWVVILMTYIIGIAGFSHVIAGAVDVFAVGWSGQASWGSVLGHFVLPTLCGNVVGGVGLVAALNYGQVMAGGAGEDVPKRPGGEHK